jgi:hypothetical protein
MRVGEEPSAFEENHQVTGIVQVVNLPSWRRPNPRRKLATCATPVTRHGSLLYQRDAQRFPRDESAGRYQMRRRSQENNRRLTGA